MESPKATNGREITNKSVTEAGTLVVNGVSISKPADHPTSAKGFWLMAALANV
jgi:hypothetical protein